MRTRVPALVIALLAVGGIVWWKLAQAPSGRPPRVPAGLQPGQGVGAPPTGGVARQDTPGIGPDQVGAVRGAQPAGAGQRTNALAGADEVLVEIDGAALTRSELERRLAHRLGGAAPAAGQGRPVPDAAMKGVNHLRFQIVEEFVNNRLLLRHATQMGLTVTADEMEAAARQVFERDGYSPAGGQALEEATVRKLIDRYMTMEVEVTEKDMADCTRALAPVVNGPVERDRAREILESVKRQAALRDLTRSLRSDAGIQLGVDTATGQPQVQ